MVNCACATRGESEKSMLCAGGLRRPPRGNSRVLLSAFCLHSVGGKGRSDASIGMQTLVNGNHGLALLGTAREDAAVATFDIPDPFDFLCSSS